MPEKARHEPGMELKGSINYCDKMPLGDLMYPQCLPSHCRYCRIKTNTCEFPSDLYYQNGENAKEKKKNENNKSK